MRTRFVTLIIIIAITLSACNLPAGSPAPDNDFDAVSTYAAQTVAAAIDETGQATLTPLPTSTQEGQAQITATQQPSQQAEQATATPVCNRASFVTDVTIQDNTAITVGKSFTKTWRLKNVGSCTWTSGYQLVFDSGDQMSGPASQQLTNGTVAPGQTVDVSVNLVAPAAPGTYKGNWKLKDAGGVIFALSTGPFWVQIKATAPEAWPTFKKGDTGSEVYAIQYLLIHHGFAVGVDGIFGNETQSKVEDFQTTKNLKEDAIVGPETWQTMIVQVSQGGNGNAVRAVQHVLRFKYNYNIAVDGIFGPATAQAVKDFQTSKNIAADGIVGPITWQKLIGN